MSRVTLSAVVLVPALIVGVAVLTTRSSGRGDQGPISTAQPFTVEPVVPGGPAASMAAVPGRPTVVAFFAAWCDPCRAELPRLEAAARRSGAPAFVGIDVLDQRADAEILLHDAGVTFPAGFDHDGSVSQRWGVVRGLPVTVLVGTDGRVEEYHVGELRQGQVDALLRKAAA